MGRGGLPSPRVPGGNSGTGLGSPRREGLRGSGTIPAPCGHPWLPPGARGRRGLLLAPAGPRHLPPTPPGEAACWVLGDVSLTCL